MPSPDKTCGRCVHYRLKKYNLRSNMDMLAHPDNYGGCALYIINVRANRSGCKYWETASDLSIQQSDDVEDFELDANGMEIVD